MNDGDKGKCRNEHFPCHFCLPSSLMFSKANSNKHKVTEEEKGSWDKAPHTLPDSQQRAPAPQEPMWGQHLIWIKTHFQPDSNYQCNILIWGRNPHRLCLQASKCHSYLKLTLPAPVYQSFPQLYATSSVGNICQWWDFRINEIFLGFSNHTREHFFFFFALL